MADPQAVDPHFARFCESGDSAALGRVFDLTADQLMRVALWSTRAAIDAEDVVQRTFLQAIQTRGQFQRGRPALPWLMGLLFNQVRKQRSERLKIGDSPVEPISSQDPSFDASSSEFTVCVGEICRSIGSPYSEVLRLHLEEGLSAHEIAAQLRRPTGTVRTQLMRALKQIRDRLPRGFGSRQAMLALRDMVCQSATPLTAVTAGAGHGLWHGIVSATAAKLGILMTAAGGSGLMLVAVASSGSASIDSAGSPSSVRSEGTGIVIPEGSSLEELLYMRSLATGPIEDLIAQRLLFVDSYSNYFRTDVVLWGGFERLCVAVIEGADFADRQIFARLLAQFIDYADPPLRSRLDHYVTPLRKISLRQRK